MADAGDHRHEDVLQYAQYLHREGGQQYTAAMQYKGYSQYPGDTRYPRDSQYQSGSQYGRHPLLGQNPLFEEDPLPEVSSSRHGNKGTESVIEGLVLNQQQLQVLGPVFDRRRIGLIGYFVFEPSIVGDLQRNDAFSFFCSFRDIQSRVPLQERPEGRRAIHFVHPMFPYIVPKGFGVKRSPDSLYAMTPEALAMWGDSALKREMWKKLANEAQSVQAGKRWTKELSSEYRRMKAFEEGAWTEPQQHIVEHP
ncbi:MAG: hypothetical protein Q9172_000257 [Xanthocarpia lactea]